MEIDCSLESSAKLISSGLLIEQTPSLQFAESFSEKYRIANRKIVPHIYTYIEDITDTIYY